MTAPTRRPKRRGCGFALALLFGLPALLWVLATWYTGAQFTAAVERLRKAGEPTEVADLVLKVPPGEPNAADLYLQAFQLRQIRAGMEAASGIPSSKWSKQDWAAVRTFLSLNTEYFRLLDQAARIERCEFPLDSGYPYSAPPEYAQMRDAARSLLARAEIQVADRQPNAALQSCAAIFTLAQRPSLSRDLMGVLVATALQGIGYGELERVLAADDLSPAACRALSDQLAAADWGKIWVRALQGERVADLAGLELTQRNAPGGVARSVEGASFFLRLSLGRPLWNAEKLANLELSGRRVEMMRLLWPQAEAECDKLLTELKLLPRYYTEFTRGIEIGFAPLEPVEKHQLWSRHQAVAQSQAARIALAVAAYRSEHGALPASLAALERAGWKLPQDPFTGRAYLYRRQGNGFIVYSTGPDMQDDGGTGFHSSGKHFTKPGYDFVFRVSR